MSDTDVESQPNDGSPQRSASQRDWSGIKTSQSLSQLYLVHPTYPSEVCFSTGPFTHHWAGNVSKGFKDLSAHYVSLVTRAANRDQRHHLYSGSQFRGLSQLLKRNSSFDPPPLTSFAHVVVRTVTDQGLGAATSHTEQDIDQFCQQVESSAQTNRLVFVRGFLNGQWISLLGSQLRIDIDCFRQHLEFLQDKPFYDLPPLPSNSPFVMRLRIPTIFTRQVPILTHQVHQLRLTEQKDVKRYLRSLHTVGKSMIREACILDESTFTLEQDVSIHLTRKHGKWTALIWFDAGRDLNDSADPPWEPERQKEDRPQYDSIPIVQHVLPKRLASLDQLPSKDSSATWSSPYYKQTMSHLPHQYGLALQPNMANSDPMYALSELFLFYIRSETQFLNMIERQLDVVLSTCKGHEDLALDDLMYLQKTLGRHSLDIQRLWSGIKTQSKSRRFEMKRSSSSTTVTCETDHSAVSWNSEGSCEPLSACHQFEDDLSHLRVLADHLCAQATVGMTFLSNGVMLDQSRRAIGKADRMERLTLLAYFFLPLSFTTSLFGTNFVEFGTGTRSIWVLFVTLVPVTIFATVMCFWKSISISRIRQMLGLF